MAHQAPPLQLGRHGKRCLDGAFGGCHGVEHDAAVHHLQGAEAETVRIEPTGPLIVRVGSATDLAVDAAVAGVGIVYLFEDWLRPHLDSGALEPILEPWWLRFPGPFLYYPGRRLVPAPLRAFIDFVKVSAGP